MNPRRRRHNRIARQKRKHAGQLAVLAAKMARQMMRYRVTCGSWTRLRDEMMARLIAEGKL